MACILIDHLPFKLEVHRDPSLKGRPALIFQRRGSHRTIVDFSPKVGNVNTGMPLQEALGLCEGAALVEADLPRYQEVFTRVVLRLGEWSPDVESAGLGCAYVGLRGLETTYGTLERLLDGLLAAVPQRLEPRLGVSDGKFPAYLAALMAEPGTVYQPPNDVAEFVARFPVEVLPVSWRVKERLHSFGLGTLAQIADLPVGPLQAQFGPTGARIWRLARGQDDTPLVPERPEEQVEASLSFSAPTATIEPLLMAVHRLLEKLFAQPEMRVRYARIALVQGKVVDRPTWERRVTFKEPAGTRARAYAILKGALSDVTLPGPLEEVNLRLQSLTGEGGRQESLFREVRQRQQLRETIAQLKASLGWNPIYQVREVEPWSRIRERRRALVTYDP